jgi:LuxR family maltose regulon positive regulatory protein
LCSTTIENAALKIEKEVAAQRHSQFSGAYSQLILEQLERANLFIVPLDDARRWYRYHHLFVDVLRGRLKTGATAGCSIIPREAC